MFMYLTNNSFEEKTVGISDHFDYCFLVFWPTDRICFRFDRPNNFQPRSNWNVDRIVFWSFTCILFSFYKIRSNHEKSNK